MNYFIGILEDNYTARKSLEELLQLLPEYRIVFSEGDYNAVLNAQQDVHPDIILLDEHLENISGISIIEKLLSKFKNAYIIIITGDKDEELVLKAMEHGAKGFLYKPFSFKDLEKAIKEINSGSVYLEPDTLNTLMGVLNQKHKASKLKSEVVAKLTNREKEVLDQLLMGREYKSIAEDLNMSYHTVNHHIKNIYLKCDVKSKGELLANYKI